jgi:molybdopterin/thiamine biosynthesis adenylyltransferase
MPDRHSEELRTFAHLAGLLAEEFPPRVLDRQLRVVVGRDVLATAAGQALVLTVARIAPRICHRIDFVSPTGAAIVRLQPLLAHEEFSSSSLAGLAALIWPEGDFTADAGSEVEAVLGLGAPGDISAGIERDGAIVIPNGRAPVSAEGGAFAALVAAGIACAQIAGRLYPEVFGTDAPRVVRIEHGAFGGSLDGATRRLGRPVVAGVGAVGCALVYGLVVTGAAGKLLLLDPDTIKDSNLMRYVLFDSRHLGMSKVDAAAQIIADSGLDLAVERDAVVLQTYLAEHSEERERAHQVVSAVDTYEARREIAGWLPKEVLNCGTTPRNFTVSRHGFGDGYACLACLYPPRPQDAQIDTVMAAELGISRDEVAQLKRSKHGLSPELLECVAGARGAPANAYIAYVGEPIDTFYNKEFCAKIATKTRGGEAVAPLAHGSALAGFLLAQVLVADAPGPHRHFRMDFVRGLTSPIRGDRRARPECPVCGRAALQAVYNERWGTGAPVC